MLYLSKIKRKLNKSKDCILKKVLVSNTYIYFIYNDVLVNKSNINDYILKKLLLLKRYQLKNLVNYVPDITLKHIRYCDVISYLNKGFLVIIAFNKIYVCEVRNNLDRGITTIESELSFSGPKDSFTENINSNMGLIRKRIKSTDLLFDEMEIGSLTRTRVNIIYMNNIVKEDLVISIKKVLEKICIDGIVDSSYLKSTLEGKKNIFPTIMMSERPDKSVMALLEGKVVILVDMSPYALILPSFFIDFFHTTDDYYQKASNATFIRVMRVFAFLITTFLPAFYIAITTRNYDIVPFSLLLMLKAGRTFVPFPAYIEALFMIICFEILKESDLRVSYTSGSAVSILGGLILGDAAVSAGIVSPIMIIIIAISSIAGLVFTSQELVNALRIYKIFILLLATFWGVYGIIVGTFFLFYNLIHTEIFGRSYFSTFFYDIRDSFVRKDDNPKYRNLILTKNILRGRYK